MMGDVDTIAEPDFEQETGDYMECVASYFFTDLRLHL